LTHSVVLHSIVYKVTFAAYNDIDVIT